MLVPNYAIDVSQLVVSTDGADIVQGAIGTADLTDQVITMTFTAAPL